MRIFFVPVSDRVRSITPSGHSSPACMNDTHHCSRLVAQQDGQAVGYEHRADIAWMAAESSITGAWSQAGIVIGVYRRQCRAPASATWVRPVKIDAAGCGFFRLFSGSSPDMIAQIKAGVRSGAGSTVTRGKQCPDIARRRPIRHDPVVHGHGWTSAMGLLSRCCRSISRRLLISSGTAASHAISFPCRGWVNSSLCACSACRGNAAISRPALG